MPAPRPFTVAVSEAILADLRERLARARFPDEPPGAGWSYGADLAYVKALAAYWRERYDWRRWEGELNRFRQFTAPVAGIDLHFIHEKGRGPKPMPLLLSHGWPGSVWEFHKILPLLTDPARFGGDPADCLHGGGAVASRLRLLLRARPAALRRARDRGRLRRAHDRRARLRALRRPGRRLGRLHHRGAGLPPGRST